jgi:hypothetical protein
MLQLPFFLINTNLGKKKITNIKRSSADSWKVTQESQAASHYKHKDLPREEMKM